MGRRKKQFTRSELRKINSAGFHCRKHWSKVAEFLKVSRRTIYAWRKLPEFMQALEKGIRRFHRTQYRRLGIDAHEQEKRFDEIEKQLDAMSFDDLEIVPKDGYVLEVEQIELEDGGFKEIVRQYREKLPNLKELQKGMKRKNGIYQF